MCRTRGLSFWKASAAAAQIYSMLQRQAAALAYVDTVHVLVLLTACLIPIGYLMKKPRYRKRAPEPAE